MDPQRKKGENLLKDGCVLLDVSGRTRELGEKSVLGVASSKFSYAVAFQSAEKKKVFNKLITSFITLT